MGIPRSLRAAALIAAAVLMGLLTVQGTYALWAANASATPGSVSSASFNVSLTGMPSGQTTDMTLAGGQAASLALTTQSVALAALAPGAAVHSSVSATNNSDAGGQFSISITAGAPTVTNVGGGSLAQYLTVSAKNVATTAECSTTTGYAQLTSAGLATAAVPKAGTTVVCFEVKLSATAPSSLKGQAVNISIPLTASQLCGVPSGCA
jgi:predicted ribosomally synthesized peptide with SipW-like signal peptide